MKIGPWEIALILIIVLIVFGAGKLPDIGRQIGKGIRDFKKYSKGDEDEQAQAAPKKTIPTASEMEAKLQAAESKLKAIEESKKES